MNYINSILLNHRRIILLLCLYTSSMVLISFGLEYLLILEPCPLCIVQKWVFIATILTTLFSLMSVKWLDLIWHVVTILLLSFGQFVSARHIYLAYQLPETVQSCGLSLEFIVANLPWKEIASLFFHGSGSCQKIAWTFWKLNLPTWAFIHFTIMWLLAVIAAWRYFKL